MIRLVSFLWLWFQCVCPLMPSCNTYHLTWVSFTLGVGYLFTATPAKCTCCSLPWTKGICLWTSGIVVCFFKESKLCDIFMLDPVVICLDCNICLWKGILQSGLWNLTAQVGFCSPQHSSHSGAPCFLIYFPIFQVVCKFQKNKRSQNKIIEMKTLTHAY